MGAKAPDETIITNFHRLIENHHIAPKIFDAITIHLKLKGVRMSSGTIVDATIIEAPSSTKNKDDERDLEKHQSKKANQWHLGMKAPKVVETNNRATHRVESTPPTTHVSLMIGNLDRSTDVVVCGDKVNSGTTETIQEFAREAVDGTLYKAHRNQTFTKLHEKLNYRQLRIRARVTHCCEITKSIFDFRKVPYLGLVKNAYRVIMACSLIDMYVVRDTRASSS